ncbi:MAG: hypothetical protein ACTHN0_19760, partial [Aquihabitans sp.]
TRPVRVGASDADDDRDGPDSDHGSEALDADDVDGDAVVVAAPRRRLGPEVTGWAVAACVVFGTAGWSHRWLHEDGLINLRIVDQVLLGHGPVFNAGERVEAFTSPAQVLVLVVARIATLGAVPIETLVFVVGVGASVAGLGCAIVGASRLWGPQEGSSPRWVPLGAAVFLAVPATWDFATSGHEGGLVYLWLGASLLVIGSRVDRLRAGVVDRIDRPRCALVLLGSGALVRPELAIYSAAFLLCWWLLQRQAPGRFRHALGWAVSLVVISEVLRMGYFGTLVPNTALAKLGGGFLPGQGMEYLLAFARPYALPLALPLLVIALLPVVRAAGRPERIVAATFVVPSVLVVAQLVAIGGDYINGRLLVAPMFGLLAPFVLVPLRPIWGTGRVARPRRIAVGVLAGWMLLSALLLRPPYEPRGKDILNARLDARELAMQGFTAGTDVREIADYDHSFLANPYHEFAVVQERTDGGILWVDDPWTKQAVPLGEDDGPTIASGAVGALGVVAGPGVRIIDRTALADPVASRLPVTQHTPGHLRFLPTAWVFARAGVLTDPESKAAARALRCGELAEVMESATEPLTPKRFVQNLLHAPANTFVKVPADPKEAVGAFC